MSSKLSSRPGEGGSGVGDIEFLKPRLLPKYTENYGCFHRSVYVVEDTRMLECQQCSKVIDPFEYLMDRAKQNHRHDMVRESLKRESKRLEGEVEELKRQKRNLQAQVRRLKGKVA